MGDLLELYCKACEEGNVTRQDWQRPQVLTTGMTGWDDVGWDVTIMVFNSGQYDYIVILYVYIYVCFI